MSEAALETKKPVLDPFRSFEVSEKLIRTGVRVEVKDPLGGGTFAFIVAYPNDENIEYSKEIERLANEARESSESETIILGDLQVQAFANTCILDWDAMEVGGNPFPCNKQNIDLLMLRARRLINIAYSKALDIKKFLKINEAAEEKN